MGAAKGFIPGAGYFIFLQSRHLMLKSVGYFMLPQSKHLVLKTCFQASSIEVLDVEKCGLFPASSIKVTSISSDSIIEFLPFSSRLTLQNYEILVKMM